MSGPVARIDLGALRHNLARARQAAPESRVMAVVKADAYGHGVKEVVAVLEGDVDAFAVARVEEGMFLRRLGVEARIVVLGGVVTAAELPLAQAAGLETVIHHPTQLEMLGRLEAVTSKGIRCWIKVDTGMHRLGLRPKQVVDIAHALRTIPGVILAGIMTHLARADERGDPATTDQIDTFRPLAASLDLPVSIGNSAAILGWPQAHGDWVRPGIMLYGASPFIDSTAERDGLRPVMTLRTHLMAVNRNRQGEAIGYGGSWICPEDMPIGIAAVGYGDGYPRHAPSGTPVLVGGRRASIVGRVSMDSIAIDLRGLPEAEVGDSVVLWGEGLPVEEVAAAAGTIPYELFCRLTRRVTFRYEGGGMTRIS